MIQAPAPLSPLPLSFSAANPSSSPAAPSSSSPAAPAAAMNWSLVEFFPEFDGRAMREFRDALAAELPALCERVSALPAALGPSSAAQWEEVVLAHESLAARLKHLEAYIECLSSADALNEAVQRECAALAALRAEHQKLEVALQRPLRKCSEKTFRAFLARPALKDSALWLSRLREDARHAMSSEQEALAADLGVDGIESWGRLYDTLTGKLEFGMFWPDYRHERLPMARGASLLEHPDRRVRRLAFDGMNGAWEGIQDACAAALNAIAGTRLTLLRRRGLRDILDMAVFDAGIERRTLDALNEALAAHAEVPRRLLRFKSSLLGIAQAKWYDLTAPLPVQNHISIGWEDGKRLVAAAFERHYPALAEYTRKAIDKQWIEYEARPGKRPGAFCTHSSLTGQARVYLTYQGALGDLRTLAHELGHAFHSHLLRDARWYAQQYPMTLAETASTFAETLFIEGMLANEEIAPEQKAMLLDSEITEAAVFLLNIPMRFEFERAFYAERASGELSPSRLRELMIETQRRVYGNALDPDGANPMFWASKLHFYITGVTFYNFPYTFGYLLTRALASMFRREGADFLPRFEKFLRQAGTHTPEEAVRNCLGRNLQDPAFWAEGIASVEEPLAQFQALAKTGKA